MQRFEYAVILAWHGVRRHPRSSAMAVVVMALGLAACMTVLTVFHTLAGDPLHGRGAAVQTVLFQSKGEAPSAGEALLKTDASQQVVERAGRMPVMAMVAVQDKVQTEDAHGPVVNFAAMLAATSHVASVFGMTLVRGRWWTARDDREHTPVAVVSQALAQRLFGTEAVLGRRIRVGGATLRIIGVHARWTPSLRFYAQGTSMFERKLAQVLMPLSAAADAKLGLAQFSCKDSASMMHAWHKCGVAQIWAYALDQGQQAQLLDLMRASSARLLNGKPSRPVLMNVPAWLRMQHVVPASVRAYVWVALSFLALCLFNAAGVLAARFMRRGSELGVRRALGASRRDVFAQHLIESGCLALVGGLLAWPLMLGALALLRAQTVRYGPVMHFSVGTFLALCVATVITGLIVGVYPAWRAAVRPPALQVKQN